MTKRFPLFIDLVGKPVIIVGGGKIALRRIEVLIEFGADITVISPDVASLPNGIKHIQREYKSGDLEGAFLAVAATNDRDVNHTVWQEAGDRNIPISVADCREECTFYFPAICMGDSLVVGVVSDGTNHHRTAKAAEKIRELLSTEDLL